MFRSLVVPLFALLFVASLSPRSARAETDTEAMRAEIRAMRQAYESRISALESEIKEWKTSGPVRKSSDAKIDQALEQKSLSAGKSGGRLLENVETNAVRGASKITLGGYTEFTYVDRGDKRNEFDQLRTVAEISAQIHERIKLYIEIEHEHGGVVANGSTTGGEIELEQAWVDFEINKALTFRAGNILVPVGRYNLYHEAHVNNLVDRPLVNRRIAPTTWWEEGLGFHGTVLDTSCIGLSYEAYLYNAGRPDRVSDANGWRNQRGQAATPIYDHKKAGAARVAIEPARKFTTFADYLELGVSGYVTGFRGFKGENADGEEVNYKGGTSHIFALDATYEKWNFGVKGEVAWARTEEGANNTGREQAGWGYYVEGYYKFWPKFLNDSPFGKDFKDPKLVFAARYDWVDLNERRLDQRDMGRVTVGIGYRPIPSTVFKFDYQYDHSPSGLDGTTLSESGAGQSTDAFLFSVATGF
jgi:hypothetical protein